MTHSGSRLAGVYYVAQAAGILVWWLVLVARPSVRTWFLPEDSPEHALLAFWLPDLLCGVLGSLGAAIAFSVRSPWTVVCAWFVAGGMSYSALYCLAWAVAAESAWLMPAFMVPAAFFSLVFAFDVSPSVIRVFRRSPQASRGRHLLHTSGQIVVFWGVFLAVLPLAIVALEDRLRVQRFGFSGQVPLAVVLFAACSGLGLFSGWTMAGRGRGTPLPFDAPSRLVVAGPYAHVRNPMAIAGLGQGTAVGLGLGSWSVLGYVIVGTVMWNLLVRPAEERDLAATFGEPYERYRREVKCWWPRTTAYRENAPQGIPRT